MTDFPSWLRAAVRAAKGARGGLHLSPLQVDMLADMLTVADGYAGSGPPSPFVPFAPPTSATARPHPTDGTRWRTHCAPLQEGDEMACPCGRRWGVEEGKPPCPLS